MALKYRKLTPPGAVAGTWAVPHDARPPTVRIHRYAPGRLDEVQPEGLPTANDLAPGPDEVVWIDVHGLGAEDLLEHLADALDLPPLALADVVNTPQRDKVEVLPSHLFVVAHQAWRDAHVLQTGQVSLFLGERYVLSLHDGQPDTFAAVRHRLRHPRSRLTERGADYLLYALIDTLIDTYFPLLQESGDRLEELAADVTDRYDDALQNEIFALRRDLLVLRRRVGPLRELATTLMRDDSESLGEVTEQHMRDCLDHASVLLDLVDTQRDLVAGVADAHLAAASHRMNQVMKMLTLIATIFIPLSFLAGVFGMNFDRAVSDWNQPELGWRYGYLAFWGLCLAVVGVMVAVFRRKRWL